MALFLQRRARRSLLSVDRLASRRPLAVACLVFALLAAPAAGQGQERQPKSSESAPKRQPPAAATDSPAAPPTLSPDPPALKSMQEKEVEGEIRGALEGPGESGEEQESSGDPILDDVLQIIRRRGSILDGSSLDPNLEETTERMPTARDPKSRTAEPADEPLRWRTAESLLRSARLLEALPAPDAERQQLIRQLRREAWRCLRPVAATSPTPLTRPR